MKNTSNFRGVDLAQQRSANMKCWRGQFRSGIHRYQTFKATEREAAIWYDIKRIEHNLEPINILKRA